MSAVIDLNILIAKLGYTEVGSEESEELQNNIVQVIGENFEIGGRYSFYNDVDGHRFFGTLEAVIVDQEEGVRYYAELENGLDGEFTYIQDI